MAKGGFGGSVKLTGASEYKKALSDISQNLKVVSAEMKATSTSFDAGAMSEKEMEQATKDLGDSLAKQKDALSSLKDQMAQMSKEYEDAERLHQSFVRSYETEKAKLEEIGKTLGTTSKEYEEQQNVVTKLGQVVEDSSRSLESQAKALNDMKIKTANAESTINQTSMALEKLGDSAEDSGKEAEKSTEGFTVMKGVLSNLATQVINSVIDGLKNMGKAMVDTVAEVGELGDEIDKESQKLGMSAEKYQELSYAMEMSGASIDNVKKGIMQINTALAGVENGVEGASEQFDALGVSLTNADGSLKSSEDVLLESIDALASMEDVTQRNALAQDIFGKSYTELAPLLNTGAEGIKDLMSEAEEYGMVMSNDVVSASADFDDSLTRMQGTIQGVKNNMVGQLLPSITTVINGFSSLANGSTGASSMIKVGIYQMIDEFKEMIPEALAFVQTISDTLLEVAPTIISALADGIMLYAPQLTTMLVDLATSLGSTIIDELPTLLIAGIRIVEALGQGLIDGLPNLISKVPNLIVNTIEIIRDYLPDILQMGISIVQSLASGLISAVPQLIAELPYLINSTVEFLLACLPDLIATGTELFTSLLNADNITSVITLICDMLPTLIEGLCSGILEHLPEIIEAGITLFTSLISNLDDIISGIVENIPEILDAIFDSLLLGVEGMADIGLQLIQGLWNGISDATDWLIGKIGEFTDDVLDAICDFFGIASPSKLMRDTVGKNLALGIGVGFESEMETVAKQMQDSIPTSFDVDTSINANGGMTSQESMFDSMVSAFKEALSEVKIEMNDEEMGKFVDATVTDLVYS